MKKGGFFRNVLDTIRSNQTSSQGRAGSGGAGERGVEFGGQLKPSHFALTQVARHGFPENPTALAFDPVQKIAAIGTKSGAIRIFGRPGAEVWAQHEPAQAVTHIRFVVNQGAIITVTADETIHLWSLRGPNLKLQFSATGQGAAGSSLQANSPAPTPSSAVSTLSPESTSSLNAGSISAPSSANSPTYLLSSITDTVSNAVDSASDYLNTGLLSDHLPASSANSERQLTNKKPEMLHNLKFQREHITCIHQTLTSKWLYIGTERGNVHVANIETFELSGYSIAWNKAIELSRKAHPGAIIHLSECPQDMNKLLIGYESGCIVLWDLKQRNADGRYYHTENLLWLAWHYEGKQFVAAHGDGSLITWQTRSNARPFSIVFPHAKTAAAGAAQHQDASQSQSASLLSSLKRSLNNELYRPINKVEWRTAKSNNEQCYLFSGGLPYDGFDQSPPPSTDQQQQLAQQQQQQQQQLPESVRPPSRQSTGQLPPQAAFSPSGGSNLASPSPTNPSVSLHAQHQDSAGSRPLQPAAGDPRQREKKSLRSTSLTVMYGKSITVLEMDDTIVDFITICDNSPYENDSSEPYAVIVLLSHELILIDLTSSGYPSFDTPYPSAGLSESAVTCIQYLADCSSDLIPFLYSSSQNVISRAPKKGYSDKEWLINGGDWGQSMQSYPELVLTGHADGTIKFWDMSGVNFDLISKIKTSKLFERPNKLANSAFISLKPATGQSAAGAGSKQRIGLDHDQLSTRAANDLLDMNQTTFDESLFAIEKIEFCSTTKRLLVAGACQQVIQFKLNKKEPGAGPASDLAVIMVEPSSGVDAQASTNQAQWNQHQLLRVKGQHGAGAGGAAGSSSGCSSSSSGSNRRSLSGFITEIICLTPILVSSQPPADGDYVAGPRAAGQDQPSGTVAYYCQVPARITALAFHSTHNILAYAHEKGVVLVDIIQKCVIINASLADLYGGGGSLAAANRDVSIQPYATSSILQHHYQQTASSQTPFASAEFAAVSSDYGKRTDNGTAPGHHNQAPDACEAEERIMESGSGKTPAADGGQPPADAMRRGELSGSEGMGGAPAIQDNDKGPQEKVQVAALGGLDTLPQANERGGFGAKARDENAPTAPATSRTSARPPSTSFPLEIGPTSCQTTNAPLSHGAPAAAAAAAAPPTASGPQASSGPISSLFTKLIDKFDSSFRRSRSSSTSSTTGGEHAQEVQPAAAESIRCIAFLDVINQTLGPACGLGASGSAQSAGSGASGAASSSNSAAPAGQVQSSAGANHKSLSPIDAAGQPAPAQLAFWLGTSTGSTLLVGLQMPDTEDNRVLQLQSVTAEPIPQASVKLAGQILCLAVFTCEPRPPFASGAPHSTGAAAGGSTAGPAQSASQSSSLEGDTLMQSPGSSGSSSSAAGAHTAGLGQTGSSSSGSGVAPAGGAAGGHPGKVYQGADSLDSRSSLFLAVVSERQARVYQAPANLSAALAGAGQAGQQQQQQQQHHHHHSSSQTHHHHSSSSPSASSWSSTPLAESPLARLLVNKRNLIAECELSESSFACRSQVVQMRSPDESCLVSYLANGNLVVHALPRLRPILMEADFVPYTHSRIAHSMRLSRNGHCLYQPSASEISKFTISAQYKSMVSEMLGVVWVPREMPEMPRTNFFKSLFGASQSAKQTDRDELFGECSAGKPVRGVAKHSAGQHSSGLDKLKGAAAGTMGHDMRLAREGLDERGEKLSEIEDRTLNMMNSAESYSQAAHQLAQKFKEKKWYQF